MYVKIETSENSASKGVPIKKAKKIVIYVATESNSLFYCRINNLCTPFFSVYLHIIHYSLSNRMQKR